MRVRPWTDLVEIGRSAVPEVRAAERFRTKGRGFPGTTYKGRHGFAVLRHSRMWGAIETSFLAMHPSAI